MEKQKKYENETNQLNQLTREMKQIKTIEMKQLEEWSLLEFDSILFNSEINDWKQYNSSFDKRLLNKQQIVILIETDDGIKFGGYVENENTFLFTFKDNQPQKFDILEKGRGFKLFPANEKTLFIFGNGDGRTSTSFAVGLDIVAHEYQHAIVPVNTNSTGNNITVSIATNSTP